MGFFGKLKFWKKEDTFSDLGLGDESMGLAADKPEAFPGGPELGAEPKPGLEPGAEPKSSSDLGQSSTETFPDLSKPYTTTQAPSTENLDIYKVVKEIEVVSSKLDALRAAVESINQRLANLERIAEGEPRKRRSW